MEKRWYYLAVLVGCWLWPSFGWGCAERALFSVPLRSERLVTVIAALYPEVLVQTDQGAGILAVTGCPDQLAMLRGLVRAFGENDPAQLQAEIERQVWRHGGAYRHSVVGVGLRKPAAAVTVPIILPDRAWAKRLGGTPVCGLRLIQQDIQFQLLVVDVPGGQVARTLGATDAAQPPPYFPRAVEDKQWAGKLAGEYVWMPGLSATTTRYSARALWSVGGKKYVTQSAYLAQPGAAGDFTRVYACVATAPLEQYSVQTQGLEGFLRGLTVPASPTGGGPENRPVVAAGKPVPPRAAPYAWRLVRSAEPAVQRAVAAQAEPAVAEPLWSELVKALPPADQPEALWYLARARLLQKKYAAAEQTLGKLATEFATHPLAFGAALQRGTITGHYLRQWDHAEDAWRLARRLAQDDHQRWQAACKLATVAYYKRQYRPAVQALEQLLENYPTVETADFVRPYLWYLKNCTEQKL